MKILALGDLHAGSRFAPWRPEYVMWGGSQAKISPAQELLNWFWDSMITDAKKRRPDVIILNGDLVEGGNYRNADVLSSRNDDQVGGAEALLRPLVRLARKACFMLRGTGFHVGRGGENEALLANLLGVEYLPELFLGTPAGVAHVCHHIGATSRPMLDQNALGNAFGDLELELLRAYGKDAMPDVRCIVRSHRHRAVIVDMAASKRLAVALAPFQLKTDFSWKVAPNTQPQISYLWIDAGDAGFSTDLVKLKLPAPQVREVK